MKQSVDKEYPLRVKIKIDDDGCKVDSPKWHYVFTIDATRTFCGGEVFGLGESRAIFEQSIGRITCPECIRIIKKIKSVRL